MSNYYLIEKEDGQRIGQALWNAMAKEGKWDAPEANALFYIEDKELLKLCKCRPLPSREEIADKIWGQMAYADYDKNPEMAIKMSEIAADAILDLLKKEEK
jgi:hypothetical protein